MSAAGTLLDMILLIFSNTLKTVIDLIGLFGEFVGELVTTSVLGGFWGLLIAVIIIVIVVVLLGKFIFGAGKTIIVVSIIGLIILYLILMSII